MARAMEGTDTALICDPAMVDSVLSSLGFSERCGWGTIPHEVLPECVHRDRKSED
jgi:hypothetical protein